MKEYRFTRYFENEVLRKRPYLKKESCRKIDVKRVRLRIEKPSVDSREISEGIVLDYDADGNLVGIDIDNASLGS